MNAEETSTLQARRRLLSRGLKTAPAVAMTLAGRPVLAGVCVTASASTSINASRPGGAIAPCAGSSPDAWIGDAAWPVPKSTAVLSTYLPNVGAQYPAGTTLLGALQGTQTDALHVLARTVVAALLNVLSLKTAEIVADPSRLNTIFSQAISPSGFVPAPGVVWYAADVTAWLTQTFASVRVIRR